MNVYLDSSALVKLYADEAGSLDTVDLVDQAEFVATSPITRVEVVSAFARAVRRGARGRADAQEAFDSFVAEASALIQVPVNERVLERAQMLVWEYGLRGYDAVQLASALTWKARLRADVTVATFDDRLGDVTTRTGLQRWP